MTALRDVWTLLWSLPDLFARWCDRNVMQAHRPEIVPGDLADWPGGKQPWCFRCDVAWPCDPFAEAADRVTGGRGDGS